MSVLFTLFAIVCGGCPNYKLRGWYQDKIYSNGVPPSGRYVTGTGTEPWNNYEYNFVARPKSISKCELKKLHNVCVKFHNDARAGLIPFKNGSIPYRVSQGLTYPFLHAYGMNTCSSASAMGGLFFNYGNGGGCEGGHKEGFACGNRAHNSCCSRGQYSWGRFDRAKHLTYQGVRDEMFRCLEKMYNEPLYPDTQPQGHHKQMMSLSWTHMSCGFAWSAEGRVHITQLFFKNLKGTPYCTSPNNRKRYTQERCLTQHGNQRCCVKSAGKTCSNHEILPDSSCTP